MICEQRRRRGGAKSAGENATEFGEKKRTERKLFAKNVVEGKKKC